jgi:signal transduction histidine kinase
MSITVPALADDNDDVDQLAAPVWLPALLEAVPGTSAILFDRELTIRAVGGPAWACADLDVGFDVGRRLPEVMPSDVWDEFNRHLDSPFDGRTAEFEYLSPRNGAEYHLTCRPVAAPDGTVRAGLLVGREITDDHRRRGLVEEIQRLSRVGCATFDRRRGWTADAEMLALVEVSNVEQLLSGLDSIVLPADQAAVRAAITGVLTNGGRHTMRYRIRRSRTRDVRHVLGSVMAVVDERGSLIRAILTHVDITPDVIDDHLETQGARNRIRLLRRVSDLLAQRFHSRRARIQQIADIIAATLGDATLVRVVAVAGGDDHLDLFTENLDVMPMAGSLRGAVGRWTPSAESTDPAHAWSRLYSSIDVPAWRSTYAHQTGAPIDSTVTHFISAPIRHDGSVLGFVHAYRFGARPFVFGDDDVLQVMSDRIGWVIAAGRAQELLGQQYDENRTLRERLGRLMAEHQDLLEQLSTVEERERLLLAEAIHDEPLQLVVAATMQLDALAGDLGTRPEKTEQVILILEDAIGKLRTLITAMTPPELTDGLGPALRRLAQAVFIVDPSVTVTVTGKDHVSLSPLRKLNVCRILREGLVNARKHARAKHIWVTLSEADGYVTAVLRDDGAGASDLDARPGHLGMATMRGRAAAENGTLQVATAPGEGTTIVLTVPVDAPIRACAAGSG